MRIIRPVTITDAMLTSSTVPETDYAAWNSATAYVVGNRCILASTHRIYECLVNNTNFSPDTNLTGETPKWLEISATNRWKVFDAKVLDQTSKASSINYVLAPGVLFDSIALLHISAASLQITVTDTGDGVVYNETDSLVITTEVFDWYSFFFEEVETITDVVKVDIPPYSTTSISITLTGGGTVGVGEIVLGMQADIGETQFNPTISIIDYSTKTQDTFGNFTILERAYSSKVSCSIWMPAARADHIKRLFERYRATPIVWVGSIDPATGQNIYSSMIIYGFYQNFSLVIPGPQDAGYNLEILSLT